MTGSLLPLGSAPRPFLQEHSLPVRSDWRPGLAALQPAWWEWRQWASEPEPRSRPQHALGPPRSLLPEAGLSAAMQLSLTRHQELLGGHTGTPTVIGNRPLVPGGQSSASWQQEGPRKGRDLEGGQLGSPSFMHKA